MNKKGVLLVLTHCHMNGWINIQQYKFILVWCTRMYQGYPGFWSPKDLGTIPEATEQQCNCIVAAAAADGKPLPGPTRDSGFPRFPCCEERPRISVISFAEYFRGRGKLLQSFCSCWSVLVYWFRLCFYPPTKYHHIIAKRNGDPQIGVASSFWYGSVATVVNGEINITIIMKDRNDTSISLNIEDLVRTNTAVASWCSFS